MPRGRASPSQAREMLSPAISEVGLMTHFIIFERPLCHLEVNMRVHTVCVLHTRALLGRPVDTHRCSHPHTTSQIAKGTHANKGIRQKLIHLFFLQKKIN